MTASEQAWTRELDTMLAVLRQQGINDERVIASMGNVRRHVFIPEEHRELDAAYGNHPWKIGSGQTISQPYIVAYMTERLCIEPGMDVLEIGCGSGYQAAVLAELGAQVHSIEPIETLAAHAQTVLEQEGYSAHVDIRVGDGYLGWPEEKLFDAIIVTCAPEEVPETLVAQLADGGRMIVPVGISRQRLVLLQRNGGDVSRKDDLPVRFVPMVHQ